MLEVHLPAVARKNLLVSLDAHDAIVPGGAKVPSMPHVGVGTVVGDDEHVEPTVLLHGQPIARLHHASHPAHAPTGPNLLLPLVQAEAEAEHVLGASTVLAGGDPVAAGPFGVLCCGDPVPAPTGVTVCTTNVFVGVTPWDVAHASRFCLLTIVHKKLLRATLDAAHKHAGRTACAALAKLPPPLAVLTAHVGPRLQAAPERLIADVHAELGAPVARLLRATAGGRAADATLRALADAAADPTLRALVKQGLEEAGKKVEEAVTDPLLDATGLSVEALDRCGHG